MKLCFYTTCCMFVMQTWLLINVGPSYPELKSNETKFLFHNSIAMILYPIRSLQFFAHATATQLYWHVQKFMVISTAEFG